jgi:hypothetical protein
MTDQYAPRAPSAPDTRPRSAAGFPRPLGDRFVLFGERDYGRLGTVYEAVDRTRPVGAADRTVALLRIPLVAGRSPGRIERDFTRLLSLRHPNVVRVFELVRGSDAFIVTMELVDGEPLRSVLAGVWPELLSHDEALDVICAVGAALVHAHERGVVHGDVGVANVLIGGARAVKVPFAAACLLRREPVAVRARDDARELARMAYELLTGSEASNGAIRLQRGAGAQRRVRGLRRPARRALNAARFGRDDCVPDVDKLVTAFAARADVSPFGGPRLRVAWAALLIVAIFGLGYTLHRNDPLPAEPIVDAEVSPLDTGDDLHDDAALDEEEPAIDDDNPGLRPVSG